MSFHQAPPRSIIHKQGCRCKRCRHPEMPWDESLHAEIREGIHDMLWGAAIGCLIVGAYAGVPPLLAFASQLLGMSQ